MVLIMGKFFINCEDAQVICDKSQYKNASLFEKLKHTFHLIYCKYCRKYSKNNTKLTECVNKSEIHLLDDSVKSEIQKTIKKELVKQQN